MTKEIEELIEKMALIEYPIIPNYFGKTIINDDVNYSKRIDFIEVAKCAIQSPELMALVAEELGYVKKEEQPKQVELPTDEEIDIEVRKLPYTIGLDDGTFNDGQLSGFEQGAKWMREQIKSK